MQSIKYAICIIIVYCSCLKHIIAQNNKDDLVQVIGEVIDAKSNKPIPFAYIFVKDTNRKAIADAKGIFIISLYKSDTTVVASFGYESRAFFIDKESSLTDKIFLKIFLDPNINMLKNVIVWGLTKHNFERAFVNEKIPNDHIYPLKISIAKEQIYKVPETGINIGIDSLIKSMPLIKDIWENAANERRHNTIINNERDKIPLLPLK